MAKIRGPSMKIPHPLDMYDVARFFSQVKVQNELHCWEWVGFTDPKGYGQIRAIGETWYTHRFSYLLFYGELDPTLFVRHKCDNPSCVNPYHLETGTAQDNNLDRDIRGRTAKGSKNGRAKLTDEQVLEILVDQRLQKEIAEQYGITKDSVGCIKRGKSWGHVTGLKPPARY
jgi:hypothetical protein